MNGKNKKEQGKKRGKGRMEKRKHKGKRRRKKKRTRTKNREGEAEAGLQQHCSRHKSHTSHSPPFTQKPSEEKTPWLALLCSAPLSFHVKHPFSYTIPRALSQGGKEGEREKKKGQII